MRFGHQSLYAMLDVVYILFGRFVIQLGARSVAIVFDNVCFQIR
jgi:hypothetical protein